MKLVTDEKDSRRARVTISTFLEKGYTLHTVDIALAESLNAIWKHTNIHKDLKKEDAESARQDLTRIHNRLRIITTHELSKEAMETSMNQNIPIYDALYISATQKLNATLYTADSKLHSIANRITASRLSEP